MIFNKCVLFSAAVAMCMASFVHAVEIGDFERDASGRVRHMNQYDAEKYCLNLGSRLPTIRELAEESQKRGAKGILETAYPGVSANAPAVEVEREQMINDGYREIFTKNIADESVVDFYFNFSGYQRPAGDLGRYWYWSSSVHPDGDSLYAYLFVGAIGVIFNYDRLVSNDGSTVRCVR